MYDIIIIGAGPAGLTSAIYGRRANKKVLVLEASSYGGQIINTLNITNYPVEEHISGFEFAQKTYEQAKKLGAEFIFEKVVDIEDNSTSKIVITNKNRYKTKTVIIATGSINKNLDLPNEKELIGKGISYCATCDGAFYKDKTVAVVGGGETALEDAIYLSNMAKKVYLIYRGEKFNVRNSLIDEVKKENIEIILNSNIIKLCGIDKLESIDIKDNNGNVNTVLIDGLFVAIGRVPENNNFTKYVELDKIGYIVAGENCNTKTKGIFVAGDVRTKSLRQLVTATSDGAIAATEAIKYINKIEEV